MKSAHASAPGKVILFGEHAVVHGQPAIAVPLDAVRVTVSAEPAPPGSGLVIQVPDIGQTRQVRLDGGDYDDPLYHALIYPAQVALRALGAPVPDLTLTVRSTIPMAGGLGSGAALAAALIRALCLALEHPIDDETLNPLVYEVEKRHHGNPSGIDNTVIVYRQPIYFVRGVPFETLAAPRPFTLLVANTGQGTPTHITVGDVRKLYEAEPERIGAIFSRIGEIVRQARAAIESGKNSALGPLMDENHALLRELTVSSDDLNRLCQLARQAGAWGAKLSGGGRGGNLIVLVDPDQAGPIAERLTAAGAAGVIQTVISNKPPE